jgi:hypothetical protein
MKKRRARRAEKVARTSREVERLRERQLAAVMAPPAGTPEALRALVDIPTWRKGLVVHDAIAVAVVKVLLDAYEATVRELEEVKGSSSLLLPPAGNGSYGSTSGTGGISAT